MRTRQSNFRLSFLLLLSMIILLSPAFAGNDTVIAKEKKPLKIDFNDVMEQDGAAPERNNRSKLKIAVAAMISPKYTYKYYQELLNLIGKRMGRSVSFVQKKTYSEVNEMIKKSELDLAFVCSGPYVSAKEEFGMEILAVPICHGERVYYSYFIASRTSSIRSFEDLQGKTFAFTDPLSNTGCMVPNYYLAKRGETPESFFFKTFFTYSHDNSIQAVADGLADGAAVDSLIFNFMQIKNPKLTEKTIIIEKSTPYGIPPVVVSPSMTPEMKEKLKDIFLSLHEHPEGKKTLNKLLIDRFVEGNDEDYKTVRELIHFLKSQQR